MAQLGEGEHLDEAGVVVLEPLTDVGERILGELPVLSLRRLPVVGGHGSARPIAGAGDLVKSRVVGWCWVQVWSMVGIGGRKAERCTREPDAPSKPPREPGE